MSADKENTLQSIDRSLKLLLKLKIRDIQGESSLKEMVMLLHSFGCGPTEIADALGKKPTDVNPILSRARKIKPNKRED